MPTATERGKNTDKARGIASSIFHKIADSLGPQKEDKPAVIPPRPSQSNSWKTNETTTTEDGFTSAFSNLAISNGHASNGQASNASFVGGFNPTFPGGKSSPYLSPHASSPHAHGNFASAPNLAPPMAMPTPYSDYPQSLTMQMALSPQADSPATRPQSNPIPTSTSLNAVPPSISSRPAARPSASPLSGRKPSKSDASSTISTSSQKSQQQQCAGVTKADKRCNRIVKIKSSAYVPENDGDDEIERFCFQHQKEIMTPSGCHRPSKGEIVFVKFEDWIPAYLQPDTQASLRAEMDKEKSKSDVPGYIYTFEIREAQNTGTIKLKVGRTVNLAKRMDQWGKQCGSKEQFLRGFFPGTVDADGNVVTGSLMKGRAKAGEKSLYCHRLERLIHIELAGLVSSSIYLDPSWPNVAIESPSTADGKSSSKKSKIPSTPCPDCGTMHKEIFEFQRWPKGPNRGKEWEKLVKPVVERWGKYVELYV